MCFQIQRDTGLWYSVEYSSFSVGPETDKYRLSVSGFSGDTGDAIAAAASPALVVNGMQFSTPDQDNDESSNHCAAACGGAGWWFNKCARSLLNCTNRHGVWNADTDEPIVDVQSARMLVKLD